MSRSETQVDRKSASRMAREARRVLRYRGSRLSPEAREAFARALADLEKALADQAKPPRLNAAVQALRAESARHADALKRATLREYAQSLGGAVLVALAIRAFLFEPFQIPTGSMIPTLLVGDHLFVNKFVYGLRIPFTKSRFVEIGSPRRGDVVVFSFPGAGQDHGKDFIKRVVAVAGDRVRLSGNHLYINGKPVTTRIVDGNADCEDETLSGCRCVRRTEILGDVEYKTQHLAPQPYNRNPGCINHPDWPIDDPRLFGFREGSDNPSEVVVPEGHVFCMGDNRDNSSDGRFWGFVPVENTKGKALLHWWPPGRWFRAVH